MSEQSLVHVGLASDKLFFCIRINSTSFIKICAPMKAESIFVENLSVLIKRRPMSLATSKQFFVGLQTFRIPSKIKKSGCLLSET
jgi:hypothetical protein